eukprot:1141402-Pelagomonas_calceolata.AAC.6
MHPLGASSPFPLPPARMLLCRPLLVLGPHIASGQGISASAWPSALKLAELYGMDPDEVHRWVGYALLVLQTPATQEF